MEAHGLRGIIGKFLAGSRSKIHTFIIPPANLPQAQPVPNVKLLPVSSLKQLYDYLTTGASIETIETSEGIWDVPNPQAENAVLLAEIVGQSRAKRAPVIAAADGHNILFSGHPERAKAWKQK